MSKTLNNLIVLEIANNHMGDINHGIELINTYSKVQTLIYPSLFEAYGLPLVEAKKYKMKIICSDLDYCWDFIEPDDFFSPYNGSLTKTITIKFV